VLTTGGNKAAGNIISSIVLGAARHTHNKNLTLIRSSCCRDMKLQACAGSRIK